MRSSRAYVIRMCARVCVYARTRVLCMYICTCACVRRDSEMLGDVRNRGDVGGSFPHTECFAKIADLMFSVEFLELENGNRHLYVDFSLIDWCCAKSFCVYKTISRMAIIASMK